MLFLNVTGDNIMLAHISKRVDELLQAVTQENTASKEKTNLGKRTAVK